MKVMVTGAAGFLGAYVLRALERQGIAALAVGRTRPCDCAGADFIAADLLAEQDLAPLCAQARASHLVHLAWFTRHGEYVSSPLNFRWVDASTRLVEAFCKIGGQHVLVAGSCAEYQSSDGRCDEDTTPLHPATVYGVAKDATRRLLMALCAQHRVPCAWARIFFPYGAGEASPRLLPRLIAALQGKAPGFGVSGAAQRDFLHAGDVAQGILCLSRSRTAGSYNLSSGRPVEIAGLVRELAQLLGKDPQAVLDLAPERPADTPVLVGNNAKLRALGWRQELTLGQGLEQMLRDRDAGERVQAVAHAV